MRIPIKFNMSGWPRLIVQALPSKADPRILCTGLVCTDNFPNAVSTFKFGTTFKTTRKARFPQTIFELAQLQFTANPIILDIGASDGSTSLDLIQALPYTKYYVTDLNTNVLFLCKSGVTWFYDEKGTCVLMASDKWIAYPDIEGAIFPLGQLTKAIFANAPAFEPAASSIELINPALRARHDSAIIVRKYNMLAAWPHEKVDLVIAANILNRAYFSAKELQIAITNLAATLNDAGRIAIIDNRQSENATIFQLSDGKAEIEKRIGRGTEIESFALEVLANSNFAHTPH